MLIDSGKVAEYRLATELLGRDIIPLWPSSAHLPYDIVITHGHRAVKIQVKGTTQDPKRIDLRLTCKSRDRAYTPEDVDIFAIYIEKLDLFYFIPVKNLRGAKNILIQPLRASCRWRKYQAAWKRLGGP